MFSLLLVSDESAFRLVMFKPPSLLYRLLNRRTSDRLWRCVLLRADLFAAAMLSLGFKVTAPSTLSVLLASSSPVSRV